MTIFDFNKRFPTKKSAIDFIIRVKYNGTYVCPFCGCVHNIYRDNFLHIYKKKPYGYSRREEKSFYDEY